MLALPSDWRARNIAHAHIILASQAPEHSKALARACLRTMEGK